MNKISRKVILDTYNNKTPKKYLKKLKFLNKYLHPKSSMFLDLKSGIVRSELKLKPIEILKYWSNVIFKSKNKEDYTATLPFAKARLQYVYETLNIFFKKNKKIKICDFASGQGVLLDIFKKEKYKNLRGVEHSVELAKRTNKKKNIKCHNAGLGFGELKKFKDLNNIDLGMLCWVLCNCINPYEVLLEISKTIKKNKFICIAESSRILVPFRKKLDDYLDKRHINDIHPWHFSKTSLSTLLNLCNFEVVYTNRYKDSDVLLIIAKKKKIRKNLLNIDNARKMHKFFLEWDFVTKKKVFD